MKYTFLLCLFLFILLPSILSAANLRLFYEPCGCKPLHIQFQPDTTINDTCHFWIEVFVFAPNGNRYGDYHGKESNYHTSYDKGWWNFVYLKKDSVYDFEFSEEMTDTILGLNKYQVRSIDVLQYHRIYDTTKTPPYFTVDTLIKSFNDTTFERMILEKPVFVKKHQSDTLARGKQYLFSINNPFIPNGYDFEWSADSVGLLGIDKNLQTANTLIITWNPDTTYDNTNAWIAYKIFNIDDTSCYVETKYQLFLSGTYVKPEGVPEYGEPEFIISKYYNYMGTEITDLNKYSGLYFKVSKGKVEKLYKE